MSTNELSVADSFSFTPESDDPNLGEHLAIRLIKARGDVLYDNVRLVTNGGTPAPIPGLRISDSGGQLMLEWDTSADENYTVEWSVDLKNWTKIPVGQVGSWIDPNPQAGKRYYRISN